MPTVHSLFFLLSLLSLSLSLSLPYLIVAPGAVEGVDGGVEQGDVKGLGEVEELGGRVGHSRRGRRGHRRLIESFFFRSFLFFSSLAVSRSLRAGTRTTRGGKEDTLFSASAGRRSSREDKQGETDSERRSPQDSSRPKRGK